MDVVVQNDLSMNPTLYQRGRAPFNLIIDLWSSIFDAKAGLGLANTLDKAVFRGGNDRRCTNKIAEMVARMCSVDNHITGGLL